MTEVKGVPTNWLYHSSPGPSNQNKPIDQKMSAAEFMKAEFDRLSKQPILNEVDYFKWLTNHPKMSLTEKT